jgi:hypothetical protein
MDEIVFFDDIFSGSTGYICLACKVDDGMQQTFFMWEKEKEQVLRWVDEHRARDCYLCPHLLDKPLRQKKYALPNALLWADLDDCSFEKLCKYGEPPPSIIVTTSPNRYQAYWQLRRTPGSAQVCEILNHRLAVGYKEEGCDQSGWDLTQLLRIPETFNNKYEHPFLVSAQRVQGVGLTSIRHFDCLPRLPSIGVSHRRTKFDRDLPQMDVSSLRVSDAVKQLILEPPDKGDRSEACFKVIADLYRAGYNATEIKAIMKQNPIGERYYE